MIVATGCGTRGDVAHRAGFLHIPHNAPNGRTHADLPGIARHNIERISLVSPRGRVRFELARPTRQEV